jgi:uncharacterized YkwD family protein/spore coat assembly protein SafA
LLTILTLKDRLFRANTYTEREVIKIKKFTKIIISFVIFCLLTATLIMPSSAAKTYTVVSGDSMWKIAVKFQVGLSEIIHSNPQIKNPALIHPGDVLTIPTVDSSVTGYEAEVIELVNEIRGEHGLSPLKSNWQLSRVARYKSQDMHDRKYFSHTSPTYGTPFKMIKDFGISYRTAGENIAKGYRTPHEVVTGWMNSSGHRANILNSSYTQIGVGYVSDGHYWTQMFIG